MEHKKNPWISFFFFLSDFLTITAASILSMYFREWLPFGGPANLPHEHYFRLLIILVPLLLLVLLFTGQYRRNNRGISLFMELLTIVRSVIFAMAAVLAMTFFYRAYEFSRLQVIYFILLAIILIFIGRLVIRLFLRRVRKSGKNLMHIIVLGEGKAIREFINTIHSMPGFGYSVLAKFPFDYKDTRKKFSRQKLRGVLQKHYIDEAYILMGQSTGLAKKTQQAIDICENEGIRVKLVPNIFSFITGGARPGMMGNIPVVSISDNPLDIWYNRFAKRLFDIAFSGFVLLVTSPFMLLIALLVRLSSRGPVLFVQERVGYNRKVFRMYKFRTMAVQPDGAADTVWTRKNDPRRTKLGGFLRRTSLDELPQFVNVLLGDMSVVGPRPERPHFVDQFKSEIPDYMLRHQAPCGITGWAQVNGLRGDTSIRRRIQADMFYIRNWSLILDIKIIVMTLLKGFSGKNAY